MSGNNEYTHIPDHDIDTTTFDKQETQPEVKQSVCLSVDNYVNHNNVIKETQQRTIDNDQIGIPETQKNHHRVLDNERNENIKFKCTSHTDDSWNLETNKTNILRNCSDPSINDPTVDIYLHSSGSNKLDISELGNNPIDIGDIKHPVKTVPLNLATYPVTNPPQSFTPHLSRHNFNESKRAKFKSLLTSATIHENDEIVNTDECEVKTTNFCTRSDGLIDYDSVFSTNHPDNGERIILDDLQTGRFKDENHVNGDSQSNSEDDLDHGQLKNNRNLISRLSVNFNRKQSLSDSKGLQHSFVKRISNRLNFFGAINLSDNYRAHPYTAYEDKDLLTGTSKYHASKRKQKVGRTFRGSYRYSRAAISMAILKKLAVVLFQRSKFALLGAFLIHITLGTVYTLSNINSYLTSYMRKHGSPNATYGSSMWISSSNAVGQGFSMVLGGYIEKRFSARLACILGCALHSISIMSTSWSVNYGLIPVLVTYGFLPGFGCGLAYMTPMSNGFGWFPNRKGLVAGVILAGFGIGTFIFNMAQTAYVNPENSSPLEDANGYFTQKIILDKVPHLFIFMGSIYAVMQFVGCCLLFKAPADLGSDKLLDERPILIETEMSLKRAIRTREFFILFLVYGITTQGVLFVNSMIKEYGQLFIGDDMYLAWVGSIASIANSLGRLFWGLTIDRFSFTQCFTSITIIFGTLMFIMPFELILSNKVLYLLCTLGLFGSFSGWMSTYPVHVSRVFGRSNSGMIYGLIYVSQSLGGILTAFGAHYLIDHFNRFVPFFCVVVLEILGLTIYHLFYPKYSQV